MRDISAAGRRMSGRALLGLLAVPVLSSLSFAAVWTVRPDGTGDFPTIQAAVSGASDGDIIELADGTFSGDGNRDVEFLGKSLTVRSQSGDFEDCIIDCEGTLIEPHRAFVLEDAPASFCLIEGITFQGAEPPSDYPYGGAIYAENAPLRILACRFRENDARIGGGVLSLFGPIELEDCLFERNTAEGGAAVAALADGRIERCTFVENIGAHEGGAVAGNSGTLVVTGSTFFRNQGAGSSIYAVHPGPPGHFALIVENTLMIDGIGRPIDCIESPQIEMYCCDLYGNDGGDWVGCISENEGINGNLSADPLFCDPLNGDFRLSADSPCAPEQAPECGLIGAWPVGCGPVPTVESSWGHIKWRHSGPASGGQ